MPEQNSAASMSDADRSKVRAISSVAYVLIFLALALPIIVASPRVDRFPPEEAGATVARMLTTLLLALIVVVITLRRRRAVLRAYARLAVGVGLLLWAGAICFTTWRGLTAFGRDVIAENRRTVAAFADLNNQFTALDMSTLLAPQRLIRHAEIDASGAILNKFRQLLDERDAIIAQHFKNREYVLLMAHIPERDRQIALEVIHESTPKTEKAFADLSAAQRDWADAVLAVLDFSKANLGRFAVQNGQLIFPDQASLNQYQALLNDVEAASQRSMQAKLATKDKLVLSTSDIR